MAPADTDLEAFYREVDGQLEPLRKPCGSCYRCCVGPPLYMTLSRREFDHALTFARPRPRIHFATLGPGRPDQRQVYRSWRCPFYSSMRGCTVYAGRPLACRVFGPMSQERIEWEFCSYQDTSRVYSSPGEIPLWDRYLELVRDSERGYVFPDQVQFERPALEMLLGFDNPAPRQPRISLD